MQALEAWTQGNQAAAIDLIRPLADEGEPAAIGLLCWFFQQMGEPRWREGVPYVGPAIEKGLPWVLNYYLGNMLNDAQLRAQVPPLIKKALEVGWQVDPVAYALGPFQQGDRGTAAELVAVGGPWPHPEGWSDFVASARADLERIGAAAGEVSDRREEALRRIDEMQTAVEDRGTEFETRSDQLKTLLDQLTNAEAQTFFDAEATKYETEAQTMWTRGVWVLVGATALALLPLLIYYAGKIFGKETFAKHDLVTAHLAPAVAIGAVAGVLLARARGRDRARQRARDLSVALGTMFVYSGQIADEEERQRFLREMGRTVIEAFLRQDAPALDGGSRSLLDAIVTRG